MPNAPTPILGMVTPTVGGDNNTWGTELNAIFLNILDQLGTVPTIPQNANFNAVPTINPETVFRVTAGAGTVTATLNSVAPIVGKVLTFVKEDGGGGQVVIQGATIGGQGSYALTIQYQYVRIQWNGATWDIVGNN